MLANQQKLKTNYDLFTILTSSTIAGIKGKFLREDSVTFPQKLGAYTFVKHFRKIGPRKTYLLALYENKRGETAIAKMKSTKLKGDPYHSLHNEIIMYEVLNATVARLGNSMPKQFKDVYIPRLITSYEDDKILLSLVEFVEGKTAESMPAARKIPLYFLMVDYLRFIGTQFTKEERQKISTRTPNDYLFLLPLLTVKAMFTYPQAIPTILRSLPVFISCIGIMHRESKLGLVHRDLHFMNILQLKKGYALIDFQQCVYTEPIHELVTTLRYWWKGWKGEKFGQLLIAEIVNRYGKTENFKKIFQAYAINSVIHGLTGDGFSDKIINGWISFLQFAINPDFDKYRKNV